MFSAHNDIFGEIFRDLDRLNPGDLVILYTNQRAYTYIVVDTKIVMPTAVEVMAPPLSDRDTDLVLSVPEGYATDRGDRPATNRRIVFILKE